MLNKLDVSKLQAAELSRSASDGGTVINTTVQMGGLHRDLKLAGTYLYCLFILFCCLHYSLCRWSFHERKRTITIVGNSDQQIKHRKSEILFI